MSVTRAILVASVLSLAMFGCQNDTTPDDDERGGTGGSSAGKGSSDQDDETGGRTASGGARHTTGGRAQGGTARGGSSGSGASAGAADDESEGGDANGDDGEGGDANGDDGEGAQDNGAEANGPRFFLPTTDIRNTSPPRLEVDVKGGIHAVYPAYAGGGAYYAYCAKGCAGSKDVKVIRFDSEGTVLNAMLALDAAGRPRVLLAAGQKIYYATCDSNCGAQEQWQQSLIVQHQGDREVSGEALALDPNGHPRFLMHTYRTFLGVGQGAPETHYVSCESGCEDADNWIDVKIADQIWESSQLRIDSQGSAHVATVAQVEEGELAGKKLVAYVRCDADCDQAESWQGNGLVLAYESMYEAFRMDTAASLALTKDDAPRLLAIGQNSDGERGIYYFECRGDCLTGEAWHGSIISNHPKLGPGIDLALDRADHPRFAFTLDYNIGVYGCDVADCIDEDAKWELTKVEFSSDLPKDDIILWPNCTIAAWFLHNPSLALGPSGEPRVGYQASDVSGGFSQPDPTKPSCTAGKDMTLSRLAVLQ